MRWCLRYVFVAAIFFCSVRLNQSGKAQTQKGATWRQENGKNEFNTIATNILEGAVSVYDYIVGRVSPGFVISGKYILSKRFHYIENFGAIEAPKLQPFAAIEKYSFLFNPFYKIFSRVNRGHYGEVWHATYKNENSNNDKCEEFCLVIKRFFIQKNPSVKLSGLREIYFGEKLTRLLPQLSTPIEETNVVRYIDHMVVYADGVNRCGGTGLKENGATTCFTKDSSSERVEGNNKMLDLWVVFENAGKSLNQILYEQHNSLLVPSRFWKRLRTVEGKEFLRRITQQLLNAVKQIHSINVIHRDIKPSNILINKNGVLSLADFGSAVDAQTINDCNQKFAKRCLGLYPDRGPSQDEETREYMPPEVRLSTSLPFARFGTRNAIRGAKQYDMWSIGIVILELLLANDNPLTIDSRTENRIRSQLKRRGIVDQDTLNRAFFLRALMEWGIYDPTEMKIVPSKSKPPSSAIVPISNMSPEQKTSIQHFPLLDISTSDILPLGSLIIAESISPKLNSIVEVIRDIDVYDKAPEDVSLAAASACSMTDTMQLATANLRDEIGCDEDYRHEARPNNINSSKRNKRKRNFDLFVKKLKESDPIEGNLMSDFLNFDQGGNRLDARFGGAGFLWRLLQLNPDDRLTVEEAVAHSFLQINGPYYCKSTDQVFELPEQLQLFCPEVKNEGSFKSKGIERLRGDTRHFNKHQKDTDLGVFTCPRCGRKFEMWSSCNTHMLARKHHIHEDQNSHHGIHANSNRRQFCSFDPSLVPECEIQKGFGHQHHHLWHRSGTGTFDVCGIRGRRLYMEDFFGVDAMTILIKNYSNDRTNPLNIDMYGVFDGHLGTYAVKYLVKSLFPTLKRKILQNCLDDENEIILTTDKNNNDFEDQSSCIGISLRKTFQEVDANLLHLLRTMKYQAGSLHGQRSIGKSQTTYSTENNGIDSGSTATIVIRTDDLNDSQHDIVTVASVGDSRGVLCCDENGSYILMSDDHKPDNPDEKERIESNGGYLEKRGVWRVNGKLAISRSFGDLELKKKRLLNAMPSIKSTVCTRKVSAEGDNAHNFANSQQNIVECLFIILATDGVWDVISNEEAVAVVNASFDLFGPQSENMDRHMFAQNASSALTQEVYVRDSRDNIGVMIIAMW